MSCGTPRAPGYNFDSAVDPMSKEVTEAVEKALKQTKTGVEKAK